GIPVARNPTKPVRGFSRVKGSELEGQPDEPARLQGMNPSEMRRALRLGNFDAGRPEVQGLPAGHAQDAERAGGAGDRVGAPGRARISRGPRRENLEAESLQRVAREQRRRLAEDDVARGPSPPQRIVVHARQVVVNERIRVKKLERHGRLERVLREAFRPAGLGSREEKERPQPFAAREDAVAHRGDEGGWLGSLPGQDGEERALDIPASILEGRRQECAGLFSSHRSGSSPSSASSSSSSSRGSVTSASGVSFRTTSTRFSISSMRKRQKRESPTPSSNSSRLGSRPFSGASSSGRPSTPFSTHWFCDRAFVLLIWSPSRGCGRTPARGRAAPARRLRPRGSQRPSPAPPHLPSSRSRIRARERAAG